MHFLGADTGAAGEKEQVNWAGETIGGPESPPLPFPPVCASVRATAPSKAGTGPAGPGTLQPRSATGDTGERGVCFPWGGGCSSARSLGEAGATCLRSRPGREHCPPSQAAGRLDPEGRGLVSRDATLAPATSKNLLSINNADQRPARPSAGAFRIHACASVCACVCTVCEGMRASVCTCACYVQICVQMCVRADVYAPSVVQVCGWGHAHVWPCKKGNRLTSCVSPSPRTPPFVQ